MQFRLLIILFILSTSVTAQNVGLVLSGGGAKGLAHLGVIKALEEHEIPIDYVVGTSMGGLVGGFYAAGYSPDHIEHLILSPDFNEWVNGMVSEQYKYYFAAKDPDASWLTLSIQLDSSLNASLNSNLARDFSLNFALTEMLAQPAQVAGYNFDSLMVPFRAVAADIFTQKEVVLKRGSLHDALRATMSVPVFYRPIRIDGKLLFDGGIYNNFPVDVIHNEFDPDVIIGVNVSDKVFNEYPYDQDEKLLNQSLIFMMLDKTDPSEIDSTGIYLEPDLSGYSGLDFQKARAIIDSGYTTTIRNIDQIRHKIDRRMTCEKITEKRNNFSTRMKPLRFNNIRFTGFEMPQIGYIKSLFNYDHEYISIKDIKEGYFKLVSEDYFKDIYPNIVYNESNGNYDFEIMARPENNLQFQIGGNIASRSISQIFLGINFHSFKGALIEHNLNLYSGRFYQSAQIKSRLNFPGKNQFYLEPTLTVNKWDFINSRDLLLKENTPAILDLIDRSVGVNIGIPVGLKYKLVFSGNYISNNDKFGNNREFVSSDTLDNLNFNSFRYGINLRKNNLNRKMYPTRGSAAQIQFDYFSGREKYLPGNTSTTGEPLKRYHNWVRLKMNLERYWLHSGRFHHGYLLQSVFSNQPMFQNYMATLINAPAFYPLQDSRALFLENFRAHNYLAAGLKNVYSINNNLDLRLEGYLFKPLREIVKSEAEVQKPVYNVFDESMYLAATMGLVYHTPLGPVSLSMNYYDDDDNKFGFLLHIGYLIYNKRSIE